MALIHSPFFTCLSYRIKTRKNATTFKLIKLLKHTQKHAITEDRILIRHYRLDKNIEPGNMPPNNPDLNPADYSILENLSQLRLYKHQRIRDMQHLKDLLKEKREELLQYEGVMHASISLDIVYLKLSK